MDSAVAGIDRMQQDVGPVAVGRLGGVIRKK
jgi:hypothetical protein